MSFEQSNSALVLSGFFGRSWQRSHKNCIPDVAPVGPITHSILLSFVRDDSRTVEISGTAGAKPNYGKAAKVDEFHGAYGRSAFWNGHRFDAAIQLEFHLSSDLLHEKWRYFQKRTRNAAR